MTWANSVRVLKQTFQALGGVIGGAFVNLLKPAVQSITRFLNTLIALVQKAVNAIGKLLGWQIRIDPVGSALEDDAGGAADALDDAAGGAGGVAKGLDDAADAAKKLNKQLMAYDEINNIKLKEDEDDAGAGSGGGGGGSGASGGGGGSTGGSATGGNVSWERYESDIGSWFQLGKKIGDYLTEAMENIDWDSIYAKAANFGRNLANFLNGLISPDLFGALGQTIAGSLNTALHFLDSFGKTFSWQNFGESLATGLNNFFDTFDFGLLADSLNTWANGLLTALIAFLRTAHWSDIGTKIGEFLRDIKFGEIAANMATALYEALNAAFVTYASMLNVSPIETALLTIGGIALFSKSSPVRTVSKWFNSAYDGAKNFFDIIGVAARDADGSFNKFGDTMDNLALFLSPVEKLVISISSGIAEFFLVKDGVADIVEGLRQNQGGWDSIWTEYRGQITQIGGAIGVATFALRLALGPGGYVASLLISAAGAWAGYVEAINQINLDQFKDTVHDALTMSGGMPLEELINKTANEILGIGESFDDVEGKVQAFEATKGTVKDVTFEVDKIHISLRNGLTTAQEAVPQLVALYDQLADAIETKIGAAGDVLLSVFNPDGAIGQAFEQSGMAAETMQDRVVNSMSGLQQRIHEVKTRIAELNAELDGGVTDERAAEIRGQLAPLEAELRDLSSSLSETETAMTNLDVVLQTHSLDWSTFLSADGSEVDSKKLQSSLDGIATAMTNVKTAAQNDITAAVEAAKALKDPQLVADIQNGIPGAMDELNRQLAEKASETTNIMQTQVIEGINQAIADAEKDWASGTFSSVDLAQIQESGINIKNKDEFVAMRAKMYKEQIIDPTVEAINNSLGDDYSWADNAFDTIFEKMFKTVDITGGDDYASSLLGSNYDKQATSMINSFGTALEAAMEEYPGLDSEKLSGMLKVKEAGESLGKDIDEGVATGVEDNTSTVEDSTKTMAKAGETAYKTYNRIGSPSKLYEEMAKFIVDGAANGINDNKNRFVTALTKMATEGANEFRKALQEGINSAIKNISVPRVSASSGMSGVVESQVSTASTTMSTSMDTMFTDSIAPYFGEEQWSGMFVTLQSTLDTGMSGISTWFDTAMGAFFKDSVAPWFGTEKLAATIYTPIHDNNVSAFETFASWFTTTMTTWWDSDLEPWFAKDKWDLEFDIIHTSAEEAFNRIKKTIGRIMSDIGDDMHKSVKSMGEELDGISKSLKDTGELANISVAVGTNGVKAYATGGFVEDGLFFANHNELVGQFDNGRTAVANNEQIVAGIQAGVYLAVRDAMRDSGGQTVQLVGDASKLFKMVRGQAQQFRRSTGANAFT